MNDYVPSTEEIREQYWAASGDRRRDSKSWAEFDRWLTEHDMEVRAQTLVAARHIAQVRGSGQHGDRAESMTPEQIATTTLGNWVKDATDERTVTQIIAQAIELDRATTRSLAAYQQISDAEERLSQAFTQDSVIEGESR